MDETPEASLCEAGAKLIVADINGARVEQAVQAEVARIRERVFALAQRVEKSGEAPARAAVSWAQEKILQPAMQIRKD